MDALNKSTNQYLLWNKARYVHFYYNVLSKMAINTSVADLLQE